MIKESGRIVKRVSERVLGSLEALARGAILTLGMAFRSGGNVGKYDATESVVAQAAPGVSLLSSLLKNAGPIPEELRRDPFPGGSVPWSIQEAEKIRIRAREIMIWRVAFVVSWSISIVALLRSLGLV